MDSGRGGRASGREGEDGGGLLKWGRGGVAGERKGLNNPAEERGGVIGERKGFNSPARGGRKGVVGELEAFSSPARGGKGVAGGRISAVLQRRGGRKTGGFGNPARGACGGAGGWESLNNPGWGAGAPEVSIEESVGVSTFFQGRRPVDRA